METYESWFNTAQFIQESPVLWISDSLIATL